MDTRTHEAGLSAAPPAAVDCEMTCWSVPYGVLQLALGRTPYMRGNDTWYLFGTAFALMCESNPNTFGS